jgi:hypothetical protein
MIQTILKQNQRYWPLIIYKVWLCVNCTCIYTTRVTHTTALLIISDNSCVTPTGYNNTTKQQHSTYILPPLQYITYQSSYMAHRPQDATLCVYNRYQQCIQQASNSGKQQPALQPFPFTVTYIMSTLTINHTDKSP